jgi:WASH complex subunit CCDC53
MEVVIDEIESKLLLLEKKLESVPPEFFDGLVVPPL